MQTEAGKTVTQPPRKKIPWTSIGVLCSTFAVVVLIIVMCFVLRTLFEVNKKLLTLSNNTQTQIETLTSQFNNTESRISALNDVSRDLSDTKKTVAQLAEAQPGNQNAWV